MGSGMGSVQPEGRAQIRSSPQVPRESLNSSSGVGRNDGNWISIDADWKFRPLLQPVGLLFTLPPIWMLPFIGFLPISCFQISMKHSPPQEPSWWTTCLPASLDFAQHLSVPSTWVSWFCFLKSKILNFLNLKILDQWETCFDWVFVTSPGCMPKAMRLLYLRPPNSSFCLTEGITAHKQMYHETDTFLPSLASHLATPCAFYEHLLHANHCLSPESTEQKPSM